MNQLLIGISGLPAAGKSTLSVWLSKKLEISHIRTDSLREYLIKNVYYYKDEDHSYSSPRIKSVNRLATIFRDSMIKELLQEGESIIVDAIGKSKAKRKKRLAIVKKVSTKIETVIIYVNTTENKVLKRLKDRKVGKKWVETYEKRWKQEYDIPSQNEAEHFIIYDGKNKDKILKELKKIVHKDS